MPWCETCDRFYNPNSLEVDGSCPTCGRVVGEPSAADEDQPGAPWHFKALLGATALYLGYRLLQGLSWVGNHL